MLNIFQKFIIEQNYSYLKLEGSTSIGSRQPIINKFNKVTNIFFLNTFLITFFYKCYSFLGPINICYDIDNKSWWIRC